MMNLDSMELMSEILDLTLIFLAEMRFHEIGTVNGSNLSLSTLHTSHNYVVSGLYKTQQAQFAVRRQALWHEVPYINTLSRQDSVRRRE
jgi:hypothetical protein